MDQTISRGRENKKYFLIAVFVSAVLLCFTALFLKLNLEPSCFFTLRNADTGEVYAQYRYTEGDKCSITFVHSINKTPVTEGYILCRDRIVLDYCLYYSFGAGVATEISKEQMLSYTNDGGMLISNMNYEIPELIYFVGTISDHILRINGEEISLRNLCGKSSKVSFTVEPKIDLNRR